ncbi:hypothetical protein BH09VER1_BH09VER1_39490 [soil metagenome]
MEIQIADHRPAFTIAISLAKRLDEPLLAKWQEEMSGMVAEVTKKFFGSVTDQQVRKGLDATVSLLSCGLLDLTGGGIDPEEWIAFLRTSGLQGTSKRAVALIKQCSSLPEEDLIFNEDDSSLGEDKRRSLLLRAITPGAGYKYLIEEIARREANRRNIRLAEWLLKETSTGRIIRKQIEDIFGHAHPLADEIFYHLIPRICGITEKSIPSMETVYMESSREDTQKAIQLIPKEYKSAKALYGKLVAQIPPGIQSALIHHGENWFDRFVGSGISKVKAKKSPSDEDDFLDEIPEN